MAIEKIEIRREYQEGFEILTAHNDANILVDVYYSGDIPESITATVYEENAADYLTKEIGVFNPLLYNIESNKATFVFMTDDLLVSYMSSYTDTSSPERVVEFLPNMSKNFKIIFESGGVQNDDDSSLFTYLHASTQIGNEYINAGYFKDVLYVGAEDQVVYLYMLNDDFASDNIDVIDPDKPAANDYVALDNDRIIFLDNDEYFFRFDVSDADGSPEYNIEIQ